MTAFIDTRQLPALISKRPFVQRGVWAAYARCDAKVQRDAMLRVSALVGLISMGLMTIPSFNLNIISKTNGPSTTISAPEMALTFHNVSKGTQRIPALEDVTSSAPPRHKSEIAEEETVSVTMQAIALDHVEIIDATTVRTGSKTVRLAGIETPRLGDICKRLDGLAVSCQDRALSYLQLLVKGRKIACDHSNTAAAKSDEGHCRYGETDVAEQMVRQGWAKAGALPEERIMIAELAAKRQKLGIWRQ